MCTSETLAPAGGAEGYNAFAKNAFDFDGRIRANDTEVKFLYNFFQNHFHKGNKFVIEVESTIDICTSCEGYLTYLKKLGAKYNKTIEYKIISNNSIKNTEAINKSIVNYEYKIFVQFREFKQRFI